MPDQPTTRTLYDDWQLRRERLLTNAPAHRDAYAELQVRVLDYLLDRYRDSLEARACPRFSVPTCAWFNHRAIVVHHHLGSAHASGVKSMKDARDRMSAIVKRMSSASSSGERQSATRMRRFTCGSTTSLRSPTIVQLAAIRQVRMSLEASAEVDLAIDHAIRVGAILPREAMEHLHQRVRDAACEDLNATDLLSRCPNRSAVGYAILAWRERMAACGRDGVAERLRAFLVRPEVREQAGDRVRAELANDNSAVRMEAASILGDIGGLADIGLLSDLLSLPAQQDEDPRERNELIAVMRKIARKGTRGESAKSE